MSKKLIPAALATACIATAMPSMAQVVLSISEDFEGGTIGTTSIGNQTLADTEVASINAQNLEIVTAPAGFTTGSGNVVQVSSSTNAFSALGVAPDSGNLRTFSQTPSTTPYSFTFDLYIPNALAVPVGSVQPRFTLDGAGPATGPSNGLTDTSSQQTGPGTFVVSYTGTIGDFGLTTDANEFRPFFSFDQGGAEVTGLAFIDNFEVTIGVVPEPASLALLGLGATALVARRRRD